MFALHHLVPQTFPVYLLSKFVCEMQPHVRFMINFVECMRLCMEEKGFGFFELKEGDKAHLDY